MQTDPLGLVDGASVYGYARQNPGRYVDPRGETRLLLQYGGIIIDRDWVRDPSLPAAVGMRWNQTCSKAQLVYHNSTRSDIAHWHYYPYGQERGGRQADLGRWYDRFNQNHLYPPYVIELPECPCDGSQVDASAVAGAALLLLFLFQPEVGAIAGAGAVAAQ